MKFELNVAFCVYKFAIGELRMGQKAKSVSWQGTCEGSSDAVNASRFYRLSIKVGSYLANA